MGEADHGQRRRIIVPAAVDEVVLRAARVVVVYGLTWVTNHWTERVPLADQQRQRAEVQEILTETINGFGRVITKLKRCKLIRWQRLSPQQPSQP